MLQHLLIWSVATAWSICDMLQLLCVDLHTTYAKHLLCQFMSFIWRKLYAIFDPLLDFPSGISDQTCKLSIWVFNFLFNSFIKDRHKIVKLQWISTKHIYIYFWMRLLIHKFAHHLCNIDITIQIVCMLLTFDTLGSYMTSIIVTVSTPKWVQITMIYQTDCLLLINMYKSL